MVGVVTVDLQYDFFDPLRSHVGRAEKAFCLPAVRTVLKAARSKNWPVVHVVTEHDSSATMPVRIRQRNVDPFCLAGSEGSELVDGLLVPGDAMVRKRSFSGFVDTSLGDELRSIDTVVLCGVATDCCVLQTAFDASERFRKRVVLPLEATSAGNVASYVQGIKTLSKSIALVLRTRSLLDRLDHEGNGLMLDDEIEAAAQQWFDGARAALGADGLAHQLPLRQRIAQIEAAVIGMH